MPAFARETATPARLPRFGDVCAHTFIHARGHMRGAGSSLRCTQNHGVARQGAGPSRTVGGPGRERPGATGGASVQAVVPTRSDFSAKPRRGSPHTRRWPFSLAQTAPEFFATDQSVAFTDKPLRGLSAVCYGAVIRRLHIIRRDAGATDATPNHPSHLRPRGSRRSTRPPRITRGVRLSLRGEPLVRGDFPLGEPPCGR
jgi:hypothetical protein